MISNTYAIVFYKNNGFKQLISKQQGVIDDLTENELYMVKAVNLD